MATRFTRLTLTNWRNFRAVDVELRERVFVCGPNAAGKTNLLDAIRFLRDLATEGGSLVGAVESRGGFTHLRSLHARHKTNVAVGVEVLVEGDPHPWSYELEFSGTEAKGRRILRVEREVVKHGSTVEQNRKPEAGKPSLLYTQTSLEQVSQNLAFRPLVDALASTVVVHVVPQVARSARAGEFAKRDAPGSDFIDQLALLPDKKRRGALNRIQKLLKKAVPQFSELDVEKDRLGRPHLKARYAHWRPKAGWQNEQEFSDGTLRLIGLLWAIENGSTPLILEEPELSLHTEVIKQIPRLLAAAAEGTDRQVFVSTHAEEMLEDAGLDPAEIVLLETSGEDTQVVQGSMRPQLVQAAKSRLPLGRVVRGLTRPKDIEQLALAYRSPK